MDNLLKRVLLAVAIVAATLHCALLYGLLRTFGYVLFVL